MAADDAARAAYRAQKEALQALLALTGEERAAALAALAARDAALARIVEARLAAAGEPEPANDREREAAPPSIARYRVHGEIGRGGMGRVWLAQRADDADAQKLAIKQVRADLSDAETQRRFEAERRILSRLDHPHIVPLVDAGRDADGRPFLVTPYVEGTTIDAYADAHALDVRARVALVRDVVAALAHAHEHLIVHRDLKPANVLVDTTGRVRLLDFGIAKMLDAATEPTAAGHSLMTLRYAAPEQIAGDRLGVGCDLYAAGVLLYELLAGHSPYAQHREPAALIHAIANTPAPPLPRRDRRGERLPRDLAAIVEKLLRKRPEERYRSAESLADELDRWLAGQPVQALAGERGYRAQRWLRRRWPWVAAAAILLGLGIFHTVRLDRQLAVTQRERDKANAIAEFFYSLFKDAAPKAARDGEITARALLDVGDARLDALERESKSPQAVAALMVEVARARNHLGQPARTVDLGERAAAILRREDAPVALADALRAAAVGHYKLDHKREYLERSREALAVLEGAGATDDKLYAGLLGNVGLAHFMLGEYDAAWRYADRTVALAGEKLPEGRSAYVNALANAGGMAMVAGDQARAYRLLEVAEREARLIEPRAPDQELFVARNLAAVARESGKLDEARERYDTLVAGSRAFHGEGHADLISALMGRGETALAQARHDDAARDLDDARAQGARAYPAGHGQLLDIDGLRAFVLLERGDLAAARALLEANATARAGEAIVEAQPRLEAVALARTRCASASNEEMKAAFAGLEAAKNISAWQKAMAQRWRDACVPNPLPRARLGERAG
ncbi:serine/threonine-protein kinase [Tahibacter soli]|uniref:Serine/threonine-protein kinase n=1 Tax=Tahibacter soli TaxID=2983605 RepID=A0A9X3YGX7_9GAMM|nr:serine/threonine-protein kinase [Tahibacter soli]MDC8012099.1 serine/threonine-protein kinase [Tahibacter soli]